MLKATTRKIAIGFVYNFPYFSLASIHTGFICISVCTDRESEAQRRLEIVPGYELTRITVRDETSL